MGIRLKRPALVFCLCACVCSLSCKTLKTGAKEEFSKKFSCPEDRVSVRERPDIDPWPFAKLAPPSDVAKDPERLAMWKRQQEEKAAAFRKGQEVFEVEGCGQKAIYRCSYPSQRGHAGRVACSPLT